MLGTTLVPVSKDSLWLFYLWNSIYCVRKDLVPAKYLHFSTFLAKDNYKTGSCHWGNGRDGIPEFWMHQLECWCSCTSPGKGKWMGFGYLFEMSKNIILGHLQSPKQSLSPLLVIDGLKHLVHLPTQALVLTWEQNKRYQNFIIEHSLVRHTTGGNPLSSTEVATGITGGQLCPSDLHKSK